jgi:hypothetical protein
LFQAFDVARTDVDDDAIVVVLRGSALSRRCGDNKETWMVLGDIAAAQELPERDGGVIWQNGRAET